LFDNLDKLTHEVQAFCSTLSIYARHLPVSHSDSYINFTALESTAVTAQITDIREQQGQRPFYGFFWNNSKDQAAQTTRCHLYAQK